MSYYHKKDNGKIGLWNRKCSKCGKTWPISAWFKYPAPSDMTKFIIETKEKKFTTYSKWADKLPGVGAIAELLPDWPRWARILVTVILVVVVACLIIFITRGF